MRKLTIFLACLLFLGMQVVQAQRTISGTVTSSEDGSTIPGASVIIQGTSLGTATDEEGYYQIVVSEDTKVLVFSMIGMKTNEVTLGASNDVNVVLEPDVFNLDEVIVAGVASGTQKKKLTVSVTKISEDALKEVPAINAATAMQGKMAGVRVTNNTGAPGGSASILIRGSTSLMGSQEPLYIVDGAIIEGTLADINAEDIESVEVVKGASAAALYGSRAGNGVVVIMTKRGSSLSKGETKVTLRNEFGMNQMPKSMELAEHHPYELKDPNNPGTAYTDFAGVTFPAGYTGGTDPNIAGNLIISEDHYADNPYAFINDHQDRMFDNGTFYKNYISVANNSKKTNFLISFENSNEEGVLDLVDGYSRQNFRVNADHYISDNIKLSASNMIGKSKTNSPGGQFLRTGGIFFDVLFLWPDCDLDRPNEQDGSDFDVDASNWNSNEENPLYALSQVEREEVRNYAIGTYAAEWYALDWLTFDAKYAFDRRTTNYTQWQPKGFLERGGSGLVTDLGYLYEYNDLLNSQTAQTTAHINREYGKLTYKAKFSYLYESLKYNEFEATGYDFSVNDVPSMDAIVGTKSIASEEQEIISHNYFGIFQFDFDDKYLADVMLRYDGSSLFGENERWNPYFRVSGAYRISEDFEIPGIQELKIRSAYGTSGQRPGFYAQYETYAFVDGNPQPNTLGNKDLKPSLSKEFEVGLNVEFLEMFSFEFVYANTLTDDQIMAVPLPAFYGYKYQWQNAGALRSKVLEGTLGARIMDKENFKWSATLTYDRIRQTVERLDIPPFQTGPIGQDADQAFYIAEGEEFGVIYGSQWLTSLDDLAAQLEAGDDISNYEINSDGYVIPKGTQGTTGEIPIKLLDADGNPIKTVIGNTNPDFHLGIGNNFQYKNFSLYLLLDWKYGGDIYNRTAQWLYRDLRHVDVDQYDVDANQKKTIDYYQALYDVNDINSHFVEDGSYVKLRELSIYYTLERKQLKNFAKGYFKTIKFGVIGRNLLTFTDYTGYDPEVGQVNDNLSDTYFGSSQYFLFDAYGYPNYRTISASLTLEF